MREHETPTRDASVYTFPGGRLDRAGNELLCGDRCHRLEPMQVETLACLLDHAGGVVSKEHLLQTVWEGRHVGDEVLTVAIYQLRRALADRARSPRYIQTIAKRGYRWIALPVQSEAPECSQLPDAADEGRSEEAPSAAPHVEELQPELPDLETSEPANAVTDPRAAMAAGEHWRLQTTPAPGEPASGVARRRWSWSLVAATLVVLALTLTTALIWPGAPWAAEPSGRWVAGALEPTKQPDVHLAQAGRLIAQRTPSSLARAREILGWRLSDHPTDAAAWALDARALGFAAELDLQRRPVLLAKAHSAAETALNLAPASPDALLSRGLLLLLHEREWARAGQDLLAANRLRPQDPQILQATAWWLSILGRHTEALVAARAAVSQAPSSATQWSDLAFLLRAAGDTEGAIRAANFALDIQHKGSVALAVRLWSKHQAGRSREGVEEYLEHLVGLGVEEPLLAQLQQSFDQGGWPAFHAHTLRFQPPGSSPVDEAIAAHYQGDRDQVFVHLTRALQQGNSELLWLDATPELNSLRGDHRFQALRAQLGLNLANQQIVGAWEARLHTFARWTQALLGARSWSGQLAYGARPAAGSTPGAI